MSEYEQTPEEKLRELQARQQEQREAARQERVLTQNLMRALTPDAHERVSNLRLVKPELHAKVCQLLLYLAQSGKVSGKITDEQVKQVLQKLTEKKDMKITRKW